MKLNNHAECQLSNYAESSFRREKRDYMHFSVILRLMREPRSQILRSLVSFEKPGF